MPTPPGLKELDQRRTALLLESELNRQALRVEMLQARLSLDRLRSGLSSGQNLWRWLAPVAGFVLARKFGSAGGPVAKGSAIIAIGQALWTAWRDRRRRAEPPGESQPRA